tara:strand:+ start:116 stop:592 length:477 start_codon:yes stop_codon:yes gene_type:complete
MKTIAEFNDQDGVNLKLTEDKIFVTSIGNEETFALRSINGVGLYDDINKYTKELDSLKSKKKRIRRAAILFYVIATSQLSILFVAGPKLILLPLTFAGIGFLISRSSRKKTSPILDSYFKLMISGNDKSFLFNKNDSNVKDVADFINKVEETLTAYHK